MPDNKEGNTIGGNATRADREALYALLGELPAQERAVGAALDGRASHELYELETLTLDLNGLEPVPAYFVHPREGQGPWPTVLFNHAHGGCYHIGKDELILKQRGAGPVPYAEALTGAGMAALCIDHWAFGERRGRSESEIFKQMLWHGQVLWGMMVHDSMRALDYLVSRPDVDASRLATLGISMGSTMAWWLAALDTRVKVCIDICCLTDFHALMQQRGLDAHAIYYYVPRLLLHFDTARINALIAPRPHLALAGIHDVLTPPAGLDRIDEALKAAYAQAGAPDAWRLERYHCGHMETAAMRSKSLAFLEQWL